MERLCLILQHFVTNMHLCMSKGRKIVIIHGFIPLYSKHDIQEGFLVKDSNKKGWTITWWIQNHATASFEDSQSLLKIRIILGRSGISSQRLQVTITRKHPHLHVITLTTLLNRPTCSKACIWGWTQSFTMEGPKKCHYAFHLAPAACSHMADHLKRLHRNINCGTAHYKPW